MKSDISGMTFGRIGRIGRMFWVGDGGTGREERLWAVGFRCGQFYTKITKGREWAGMEAGVN